MASNSLISRSASRAFHKLHPRQVFLRPKGALIISFLSTAFLLTGLNLIAYLTYFPPRGSSWRLPDWHSRSQFYSTFLPESAPECTLSPSPSSLVSDVLTVEQIRDIVASTRGFFSRDYCLNLGWNNVSVSLWHQISATYDFGQVRYIIESALLQAELLNRTLVLPSFINARGCVYDKYVTLSLAHINALILLLLPPSTAPFVRTMHLCSIGMTDRTVGKGLQSNNIWVSASQSRL